MLVSNLRRALPVAQTLSIQQRFGSGFTPSQMPEVKRLWDSAGKVGQICKSMRNVAAGALPGAERHLANARPFGGLALPFFQLESDPKDVQHVLHIAIGTERGLCGAVSSNTVKAIQANMKSAPTLKHQQIVFGKRSGDVAKTYFGETVAFLVTEVKTKIPTFELACQVAEHILYKVENWDKIILYYNQYINASSWKLAEAVIYKTQIARAIAEIQMLAYEIEGDEATLVDNLAEFKLASQIYMYLAENAVSEQASRLRSMDTASKNCEEKVKEYEKIYQGLRKSKITNELIILSAAAKMAGY